MHRTFTRTRPLGIVGVVATLGAAGLLLSTAWFIYARRRQACASDTACATVGPARRAPIWLVFASAIVLLALIWQPWIESLLLRLMR